MPDKQLPQAELVITSDGYEIKLTVDLKVLRMLRDGVSAEVSEFQTPNNPLIEERQLLGSLDHLINRVETHIDRLGNSNQA